MIITIKVYLDTSHGGIIHKPVALDPSVFMEYGCDPGRVGEGEILLIRKYASPGL